MIDINSKLYEIMTVVMQIIFISIICFVIAIPILTLPLAILLYCVLCGNVVRSRKLFHLPSINKEKVIQLILYLVIGWFSLQSSFILMEMKDFFISRLILSLILSFYVAAGILVIEGKMTFMEIYRNAFLYSGGFFYKNILPVFIYLMIMSKIYGMLPVYSVYTLTIGFCYFIFKWNHKGLIKLFKL